MGREKVIPLESLKILHCPTTVGGNPQGLVHAERRQGLNSKSISLTGNYLNYAVDEIIQSKVSPNIIDELRRWQAVYKSLKQYDILHYNYGRSLTPIRDYPRTNSYPKWVIAVYCDLYARYSELLDVKMASKLNKVIAVTYQGDDARQGDFCRSNFDIHYAHEDSNYYNDVSDEFTRQRIRVFDQYADLIYAVNPDLLHVLPKRARFVPYASVDPRDWTPCYSSEEEPDIPHVVHAPSNRLVKGTKYIIQALDRLKAEGVPFRYTLVENMSHKEARKIYETADILVDQLLAGYYGALAVELMALGKPVICYMRQNDLKFMPEGMQRAIPIINATPDSFYEVLKVALTTEKHQMRKRGIMSRQYVETWHDPISISASIIADYKVALEKKPHKGS